MRILYLHQYFLLPSMSGGTRSYEMARRLVLAGHEVHMITAAIDPQGDHPASVDGIHLHWLDVPYSNRMSNLQRLSAFVKFAVKAGRRAKDIGGDIVFATSTPLTIALPGVFAARRLKIPMVFEVRDLWPEMPIAVGALRDPVTRFLARSLEKFAYRNSSHVVALSPGMADGVAEAGYPKDQITVIPNGCDLELLAYDREQGTAFLDRHPHLKGGPLVVYTGTLGRVNGVGYLAEIAAAAKDSNLRFLIVGDGFELQSVRERAEGLGVLERNLWLLPPVKKSEMVGVLSAATLATSLFVDLEPMWKNSANKFFDALASGTPVAINYGGWQAELLQETGAGLRVPATNAQQAAELIGQFASDETRVKGAAQAARRLAERNFDRDYLASQLLSVFDAVQREGQ